MILVKEKSAESVIFVPKHWSCSSALTFSLKSRLTNDEYSYFVDDLSGITDYFVVTIDTSNVKEGEYEYRMTDDEEERVVSSGLLIVGEYKSEKDEYNYNQEYVEYNYE